ncbi:DNL zinc finger-domain-containing protein, partial [Obelidium mucronatum]
RLLIGFNCNKCDHRTHKLMSKKAYETGVVIITCEGCSSKHLIADHLGWFDTTQGKIGTIEDIIARKG